MKVPIFLSLLIVTLLCIKGDGTAKSPKNGGGGPNDSKDKDKSSPSSPNKPSYDDDDIEDILKDLSQYVNNLSSNSNSNSGGKGYGDSLYSGYGQDNDDNINNKRYSSSTVDIVFRPYGSVCPRTINPSNTNTNSDKDFLLVIFGSSRVDVKTIEPYSIRLSGSSKVNGIYPVSWDILDFGQPSSTTSSTSSCHCSRGSTDGKLDLIVRFKEASVVKIPEVSKAGTGNIVTLIIKAHTSSSSYTYIKGEDCIKVV